MAICGLLAPFADQMRIEERTNDGLQETSRLKEPNLKMTKL